MTSISYADQAALNELFIGRRIVSVYDSSLYLDDGRVLEVVPNEGGCICGAGDYELTSLATCNNAITRVEVEEDYDTQNRYAEGPCTYRLFVFAENTKIAAAVVEGDDGSGYYGTGFEIRVRG